MSLDLAVFSLLVLLASMFAIESARSFGYSEYHGDLSYRRNGNIFATLAFFIVILAVTIRLIHSL